MAFYKGLNLMLDAALLGKVPNLTVLLKIFFSCNECVAGETSCPCIPF